MGRLGANKITFTWSRALIELVIVAAGVLLALALDQWMESRKDRAEEVLLLDAMRTEFQSIVKDMDEEMAFRRAMMANANHIFALAAADNPPDPREFDVMLGRLLWWSSVDFTIGAGNSVLVGGKLRLIENEEVRFFLASLPERLARTKQTESNDYWTLMNFSVPYLSRHSDITQIVMTMDMRPGGQDRQELEMRYHPKVLRDHTGLLGQTEFIGVVGAVAASQINVMSEYETLRPQFERAISLLDAELGTR